MNDRLTNNDKCDVTEGHDRGAFSQLGFSRCQRGFTLTARDMRMDGGPTFAFDRIEDLAAWLVEQYGAVA